MRSEFDRLQFLKWQTIARYGQGNDVREAKEKMAGMQGTRAHKEAKRKRADGVEEDELNRRWRGRGPCRLSALAIILVVNRFVASPGGSFQSLWHMLKLKLNEAPGDWIEN